MSTPAVANKGAQAQQTTTALRRPSPDATNSRCAPWGCAASSLSSGQAVLRNSQGFFEVTLGHFRCSAQQESNPTHRPCPTNPLEVGDSAQPYAQAPDPSSRSPRRSRKQGGDQPSGASAAKGCCSRGPSGASAVAERHAESRTEGDVTNKESHTDTKICREA